MAPQGLQELTKATRLRVVNLVDCDVSDEAVEEFLQQRGDQRHPAVAVSYTRDPDSAWALMDFDTVRPLPPPLYPCRFAHA